MYKILITGGNGNIAKIIKNNLGSNYNILNPSQIELNLLDPKQIKEYLTDKSFDILIHTAIVGGRRTKLESAEIIHHNLIMFENIILYSNLFKMILNLDSAASYDRSTNIMNRSEEDLYTVPLDFYGFSKYCIYKRSLSLDNMVNLRIFNIYHEQEEPDRFIASCLRAKYDNSKVTIFEDKYFDFFSAKDFIKVLDYYIKNCQALLLPKTLNLCYKKKQKLSEIANLIIQNTNNIIVKIVESNNNYCGNSTLLYSLNLNINSTLEESLSVVGHCHNNLI
jgi:nucleoside-diphosphate-sugar epimerase